MLINMRNGLMAGGKLSAKSYVQDGLFLLLDGIENIAWGVHDGEAEAWVDLINGVRFNIGSNVINNDHVHVLSAMGADVKSQAYKDVVYSRNYTLEVLFRAIDNNSRRLAFCIDGGVFSGCGIAANKRLYSNVYPYGDVYITGYESTIEELHLVSGTSNSATFSGNVYIDGDFKKTSPSNSVQRNTNTLQIGLYWAGDIYSVRMYSREITAAEVAANYAVDKARFNLPDAS